MLFDGRNRIRFPYSRYGYTRGNGKVWHGGVDVDGLDDSIIHFPRYADKSISGTVTTARIVTDKRNKRKRKSARKKNKRKKKKQKRSDFHAF